MPPSLLPYTEASDHMEAKGALVCPRASTTVLSYSFADGDGPQKQVNCPTFLGVELCYYPAVYAAGSFVLNEVVLPPVVEMPAFFVRRQCRSRAWLQAST